MSLLLELFGSMEWRFEPPRVADRVRPTQDCPGLRAVESMLLLTERWFCNGHDAVHVFLVCRLTRYRLQVFMDFTYCCAYEVDHRRMQVWEPRRQFLSLADQFDRELIVAATTLQPGDQHYYSPDEEDG